VRRYRRALIVAAILLAGGLAGPRMVGAQSDVTPIVPDAFFVSHECQRLTAAATKDSLYEDLAQIKSACLAYDRDRNGDRWYASIKVARGHVDGYERDHTQHALLLVRPGQIVPQGANAYAIFLAPSRTWSAAGEFTDMRQAFDDFGASIGGSNLAIWFELPSDPDKIDVDRSRYYFDLFGLGRHGLDPNAGPYIVLTSLRPDLWSAANDVVVFKLSGLKQDRVTKVLKILATDIAKRAKKKPSLDEIEAWSDDVRKANPATFEKVQIAAFRGAAPAVQ
jgi:hypothetical protein